MHISHGWSMAMLTIKDAFDMSAQAAICACSQLRILILRPFPDTTTLPSEKSLSQTFMASLPELRVLHFQTAR